MAFSRAELPVFKMRLAGSSMEVSGNTSDNYSVQLCAEAGAASESDAKALLEEIKLTREDKMLLLSTPKYVQEWPSTAFVQVQAPQETPVSVIGEYAAMRVIGMHAAVKHGSGVYPSSNGGTYLVGSLLSFTVALRHFGSK